MRIAIAAVHAVQVERADHVGRGVGKPVDGVGRVTVERKQRKDHLSIGLGRTKVAGARIHLALEVGEAILDGSIDLGVNRVRRHGLDRHSRQVHVAQARTLHSLVAAEELTDGIHETRARPGGAGGRIRAARIERHQREDLLVGARHIGAAADELDQVDAVIVGDVLAYGGESQRHTLGLGQSAGRTPPLGLVLGQRGMVVVEQLGIDLAARLGKVVDLPLVAVLEGVGAAARVDERRGSVDARRGGLTRGGARGHTGHGDGKRHGLGGGSRVHRRTRRDHRAGRKRRHRVVARGHVQAVVGSAVDVLPSALLVAVDAHDPRGVLAVERLERPGEAGFGHAPAIRVVLTGKGQVELLRRAGLEVEAVRTGRHARKRILVGISHVARRADDLAIGVRVGQRRGKRGGAGLVRRVADLARGSVGRHGRITARHGKVVAVGGVVGRHHGACVIGQERAALGEWVAALQVDGRGGLVVAHRDGRGGHDFGRQRHALGAGARRHGVARGNGDRGAAGMLEVEAGRVVVAVDCRRIARGKVEAAERNGHVLVLVGADVMHAHLKIAHLGALDGSRAIGHVAHGAVGGAIPQLKVVELLGLGLDLDGGHGLLGAIGLVLGGGHRAGGVVVDVELARGLVDADVTSVGIVGAPGDGARGRHTLECKDAQLAGGVHSVGRNLEHMVGNRLAGAVVGREGHGVGVVGRGVLGRLVAVARAENRRAIFINTPSAAVGAAVGVDEIGEGIGGHVSGVDSIGVDERRGGSAHLVGEERAPVGVDELARAIGREQRARRALGGRNAVGHDAAVERARKARYALAGHARGAVEHGALNLVAQGAERLAVRRLLQFAGKRDVLHHARGGNAVHERLHATAVGEGDGVALAIKRAREHARGGKEVLVIDGNVVVENVVGVGVGGFELAHEGVEVVLRTQVHHALRLSHGLGGLGLLERGDGIGERLGCAVDLDLCGIVVGVNVLGRFKGLGEL